MPCLAALSARLLGQAIIVARKGLSRKAFAEGAKALGYPGADVRVIRSVPGPLPEPVGCSTGSCLAAVELSHFHLILVLRPHDRPTGHCLLVPCNRDLSANLKAKILAAGSQL